MSYDAPDWQKIVTVQTADTVSDAPDWQNVVTGPGGTSVGGYASLTGEGETEQYGALTQTGDFTVEAGLSAPGGEFQVSCDDGGEIAMSFASGAGLVFLGNEGTDPELQVAAPSGTLTLSAVGGKVVIGDTGEETAIVLYLPTTAGASGTLWNNAGVVSVAP